MCLSIVVKSLEMIVQPVRLSEGYVRIRGGLWNILDFIAKVNINYTGDGEC